MLLRSRVYSMPYGLFAVLTVGLMVSLFAVGLALVAGVCRLNGIETVGLTDQDIIQTLIFGAITGLGCLGLLARRM